jgi:hypothetical protein
MVLISTPLMRSKILYTRSEADEIIDHIQQKLKAEPSKQKNIRAKIRARGFYASEFGFRNGYTAADFLSVIKIINSPRRIESLKKPSTDIIIGVKAPRQKSRSDSDESYIIDLCDEVLKRKAIRQHRFDFLRGDAGTRLPVDAWYPDLNLVIEFREKQHTEAVKFFDKRETASGINRGEQRKKYDQLRRDVLPAHGIRLLELGYDDFEHARNKKLMRNRDLDMKVIKGKLK